MEDGILLLNIITNAIRDDDIEKLKISLDTLPISELEKSESDILLNDFLTIAQKFNRTNCIKPIFDIWDNK